MTRAVLFIALALAAALPSAQADCDMSALCASLETVDFNFKACVCPTGCQATCRLGAETYGSATAPVQGRINKIVKAKCVPIVADKKAPPMPKTSNEMEKMWKAVLAAAEEKTAAKVAAAGAARTGDAKTKVEEGNTQKKVDAIEKKGAGDAAKPADQKKKEKRKIETGAKQSVKEILAAKKADDADGSAKTTTSTKAPIVTGATKSVKDLVKETGKTTKEVKKEERRKGEEKAVKETPQNDGPKEKATELAEKGRAKDDQKQAKAAGKEAEKSMCDFDNLCQTLEMEQFSFAKIVCPSDCIVTCTLAKKTYGEAVEDFGVKVKKFCAPEAEGKKTKSAFDKLVAAWNSGKGGKKETIALAKESGKESLAKAGKKERFAALRGSQQE